MLYSYVKLLENIENKEAVDTKLNYYYHNQIAGDLKKVFSFKYKYLKKISFIYLKTILNT